MEAGPRRKKMKKRVFTFLICAALLLALHPAASAFDAEAGFYGVGAADGFEICPVTEEGTATDAVVLDADGDGAEDLFYSGTRALAVTLTETERGAQYLLTVSSPERILYVDQRSGGGALRFLAAFPLPEQPTALTLELGSTAEGFAKRSVPLVYTPAVQTPEPGFAVCGRDEACPMGAFADLDRNLWYHDGVHWALENSVMNGVGGDLFAPGRPASRAMVVTMLWRMEGMPRADAYRIFDDVEPAAWYADAVRWAAGAQIVEGYSPERFAPGDNVTREQLGVILRRYTEYNGMDALNTEPVRLGVFLDAEHISGWALDGVQWAVNAGLISGTGHEKLSPKADAGRAQVATMLMRYALLADADHSIVAFCSVKKYNIPVAAI